MLASAANYIGCATRCKETWDESFRRGDRLTERELIEMHGAGLGLVWATHQTDLHSALVTLYHAPSQWGIA
jgi:hypothetical protein